MTLGAACFLCLASFTSSGVKDNDPLTVEPTTVTIYSEYQFYKDAYIFRTNNKMEIPTHYYDKLGIPNPNPPIVVIPPPPPLTPAQENRALVADWILRGILMRETKSYYGEDGRIVYVDKTIGAAGERGPFQMRRICFDTIDKPGESFSKLSKNTAYAEELTVRYLLYLYNNQARKNWKVAIGMYNVGPSNYKRYINSATNYYNDVKKFGEQ